MKNIFKVSSHIGLLILSFFISVASAQVKNSQGAISDLIENTINQTDPNLNIGIKVQNLQTGKTLYERNAERYFIPASSLKFITIIGLMEYFGPDYKFTSRVLKNANNYYIDIHHPNFDIENLKEMIAKIAKDSAQNVKGNIYVINKQFSVPPIMREKLISDTIYCNGALITKVHLNKNCATVNVKPGKVGKNISVLSDKNFPYIIENNAKTIKRNQLDRLHVKVQKNKYTINGTLAQQPNGNMLPIGAVTEQNIEHVIYQIRNLLKISGIKLKGKVSSSKIPPKYETIYSDSSLYKDVASKAMKISNNYMTDYLLAEYATKKNFSEWRQAIFSLKDLIKTRFGVDLQQTEIHDASGLSRRNLISLNHLSSFAQAAYQSPNFPTIKDILARPGDDCTLRDRLKGVKNLYVKTGTLRHVSCLVGYFENKKGDLHSFVIMANNFYPYSQSYRQLEDKIVKLLIENS